MTSISHKIEVFSGPQRTGPAAALEYDGEASDHSGDLCGLRDGHPAPQLTTRGMSFCMQRTIE